MSGLDSTLRFRSFPVRLSDLYYSINYSQVGIAEPGNPNFEIKMESLALSNGASRKLIFDRDHAAASPLKHALRYVDVDYGIL